VRRKTGDSDAVADNAAKVRNQVVKLFVSDVGFEVADPDGTVVAFGGVSGTTMVRRAVVVVRRRGAVVVVPRSRTGDATGRNIRQGVDTVDWVISEEADDVA
jgi:hypothetical protein